MKRKWKRYLPIICCALALAACGENVSTVQAQTKEAGAQETAEIQASALSSTNRSSSMTGRGTAAQTAASSGEDNTADESILIAYFTWADNTVVVDQEASLASALAHYESMGDSDRYGVNAISSASILAPGNAARMAEWIQEETGGTLFSITAADPYPSDYDACMDRAADEKAENARPALTTHVEDFEQYDTIFIGFPNWWSSLPMPVLSFIDEYDFSGKTVIPFCTHGTGGIAATVRELERALPDSAEVLEPIGVYRAEVLEAQPEIREWLQELGFAG